MAIERAGRLAARVSAVANVLADPSTPSVVVQNASAWIDSVYTLEEEKRSKMVWTALVEAIEEVLAIRRKLSAGRDDADEKRAVPPPPSLKALANWVPAKVGARVPWASYVDWLHENADAIEHTLTLCESGLDWRALHELARGRGAKPPEWKSMKAQYNRRRIKDEDRATKRRGSRQPR